MLHLTSEVKLLVAAGNPEQLGDFEAAKAHEFTKDAAREAETHPKDALDEG